MTCNVPDTEASSPDQSRQHNSPQPRRHTRNGRQSDPTQRPARTHRLTRDEITSLLQNHFILPTRPRIEIALVLFNYPQHLSADEILHALKQHRVTISRASVYNTLNLFVAKNLVRELHIDPTRSFYDRNTQPHHHIYDVDSGTLTDISAHDIRLERLPALPEGTMVTGIDIIVRTRRAG